MTEFFPMYKRYKLWQNQRKALRFCKQRGDKGTGLFLVMGAAKTRICVHYLEHLFAQGAKLVYVAAPLTVLPVWPTNWDEWATYPVTFINLHESGSAGLRKAVELSSSGWPVICLINYDSAWRMGMKRVQVKRRGQPTTILKKVDTSLDDVNWDVGILDESTAIKNRGSKVSRFFRAKMRSKTEVRLILTGSAYTHRILDLWAQIKFLTGEEIFQGNFEAFADRFAIPHPHIRGAYAGYKNIPELVKLLDQCCILTTKEDMTDLPPFTHVTRYVTLGTKAASIYMKITEEMYAEFRELGIEDDPNVAKLKQSLEAVSSGLESENTIYENLKELRKTHSVTAEHVFQRMQKWGQITSGYIIPDADEDHPEVKPEPVILGTEKVEALMEVLDQRDPQIPTVIVVQSDFEEIVVSRAIQANFKVTPKVLNGSVKGSTARNEMILEASKEPFFIVKEAVAARGIDMRWTDCIVFFSHRYSTELYDQMLSRNHRGGVQHEHITYVHLLVKSTIDIDVLRSLNRNLGTKSAIDEEWRALKDEIR